MSKKSKTLGVSASLREPEKQDGKPALVPKLRFPEFRDAEGWEQTTLGDVARLKNGYAFKSSEYVDFGPFQIITIANVQQGELSLDATKRIAELPSDIQAHQRLSIGDILISMTGNVGRICRVTCEALLLNQRVGKLIPEGITPDFFYHLIQRDEFRNSMQLKAAGGAQGNLSGGDITDYALHCPAEEPEQQRIAECLSSVDELMAAQARKVDALKTHKKGLMQQLFPREGETQPRLRFPEFQNAGEWVEKSLGGVARLRNGYAFKSAEYVDGGPFQIITIANVQQGNLAIESTKRIAALPSDIQQHQILCLGDILISMTGNVGRICRVTAEGLLLNQRVGKLIPEAISDAFFYQLLQRDEFRNTMQLKAAGGAQGNLSGGDITEYGFNMPAEPEEQQRIADCLTSLDDLIAAQTQKLDALKTHKKGLMQQLFPAGEGDPRQAAT